MFDDDVTKIVFWVTLICLGLGLISLGVLFSIVYGAFVHG